MVAVRGMGVSHSLDKNGGIKHMEKIRKTLDLNVDVIERVEKYRLDNQFSTFTSALNHFLFTNLPPVKNLKENEHEKINRL
jgi:hypothetical protein